MQPTTGNVVRGDKVGSVTALIRGWGLRASRAGLWVNHTLQLKQLRRCSNSPPLIQPTRTIYRFAGNSIAGTNLCLSKVHELGQLHQWH